MRNSEERWDNRLEHCPDSGIFSYKQVRTYILVPIQLLLHERIFILLC